MKKITFLFAMLLVAIVSYAQVNIQAPLQRDPAIKYGTLANGMRYYILHNEKPAQRAEFYLFTDVGALQETPAQDGLAHFMEHMCLNGTKNLPGKSMISYFESIGASFGGNINASTGVEQTMYMLNNIPTIREGIIDTALLVMHDYAAFVTNDPAEIDAERGVIVEEWRTRRTADWRMHEQEIKYLYKGSKYETTTIIGSKENLENFPASELVDFYKTWYRPDLQAVVVVGDIDPEAICAKLEALFKDIPAQPNAKQKDVHEVPGNTEPIVGIITDPECRVTSISMYVKNSPLPKEYNSMGIGAMSDLLKTFIGMMFNERLLDITLQPDAPFFEASIGFTRAANTLEPLELTATSKEGEIIPAFTAVLSEFEKAKRFGFNVDEFDRAKTSLLNSYERSANNAQSRENSNFINGIATEFYYGFTMMHPQYAFELTKGLIDMLSVNDINQVLSQLNYNQNVVLLYKAPEKDGLTHPSEADLTAVLQTVANSEMENNSGEAIAKELMDSSSLVGSKVIKTEAGAFGSTVWTLSNGLKVIVRPSDLNKEQVLFQIGVRGGKGLLTEEETFSFEGNAQSYFNIQGVSDFPFTTLQKMMTGKNANVSPFFQDNAHGFSGSCSPKDIETMLQLAYLKAVKPYFSEDEFAPLKNQLDALLPNLVKEPIYVLSNQYYKTTYNNPRKDVISIESFNKVSLSTIERCYRQLMSNFADANIVFAGNVDLDVLKPLVEKYIGSLPVGKVATKEVDHNLEIEKGDIDNTFEIEMTTPKTSVVLTYSAMMPYTPENNYLMSSLSYILNMIYTETLREGEGGTYGASEQADITLVPKQQASLLVQFDTDPERANRMIEIACQAVEDLAKNGPSEEQMEKAKQNLLKNLPENRISNSYWLSAEVMYYKYNIDSDTEAEALINSLTADNVKNIAAQLVNSGNFVKVVMTPKFVD